ncbi:hypothetical protein ACF0H5_005288 [Mactra antiquata]
MKATVNIGKLDDVKIHDEESSIEKRSETVKLGLKWKILATVSTVLLLLSAILLSSYWIIQHNNKQEKHYEVTIHNPNGVTESERVIVTDIEEEFETNSAYLIFDFSTGLTVTSFKNNPDFQDCYVNSFNMSEIPTPDEIKNKYTHTKVDLTVGDQTLRENYQVTDIILNNVALSSRSKDLCDGKSVYILRQLPDDHRVRREDKPKKETTTKLSFFWGLVTVEVKVTKN